MEGDDLGTVQKKLVAVTAHSVGLALFSRRQRVSGWLAVLALGVPACSDEVQVSRLYFRDGRAVVRGVAEGELERAGRDPP